MADGPRHLVVVPPVAHAPAEAFPRFPVGPFDTSPRRTLNTHANIGLAALYAVANQLAGEAEQATKPAERVRALAAYSAHLLALTKFVVGQTTHVNVKLGGQEAVPRWADVPLELRQKFEALAEAAQAAGVDVGRVLGGAAALTE